MHLHHRPTRHSGEHFDACSTLGSLRALRHPLTCCRCAGFPAPFFFPFSVFVFLYIFFRHVNIFFSSPNFAEVKSKGTRQGMSSSNGMPGLREATPACRPSVAREPNRVLLDAPNIPGSPCLFKLADEQTRARPMRQKMKASMLTFPTTDAQAPAEEALSSASTTNASLMQVLGMCAHHVFFTT